MIAWMLALCCMAADVKPDYAEFSNLVHRIVAKEIPRQFEDASKWGKTVPAPKSAAFLKLRKRVDVNGEKQVPHGAWRRTKAFLDDTTRDLSIVVIDFRKVDSNKSKLIVRATVRVCAEIEHQQWQKGLKLLGVTIEGSALVSVVVDCELATCLKTIGFLPELCVEPNITNCTLGLEDVKLQRIGSIQGDLVQELGDELRSVLQAALRRQESKVKQKANEAIAKAVRDGKGSLSAAAVFKLLSPKPTG